MQTMVASARTSSRKALNGMKWGPYTFEMALYCRLEPSQNVNSIAQCETTRVRYNLGRQGNNWNIDFSWVPNFVETENYGVELTVHNISNFLACKRGAAFWPSPPAVPNSSIKVCVSVLCYGHQTAVTTQVPPASALLTTGADHPT